MKVTTLDGRELPLYGLDFETYYDKDYTLSKTKMTTTLYVRDERFKAHGVGIQYPDGEIRWHPGDDAKAALEAIDWDKAAVCAHNCLPGDTEVLTPTGWVPIEAAEPDQEIMQWDPSNNVLSWVTPVAKIQTSAESLLEWDTTYHRGAYTLDHRIYFQTPDTADRWRAKSAEEVSRLSPNNTYIPLAGQFDPVCPINLSADEARFMEAVRADGSYQVRAGKAHRVQFRLKKERKLLRLQRLASSLGLDLYIKSDQSDEDIKRVWFRSSPLLERVTALLGREKVYGTWVMKLSLEAKLAILDEALFWDGSEGKTSKSYSFFTADKSTSEAFQLLAHTSGQTFGASDRVNDRGFSASNPGVLFVGSVRQTSRAKLITPPKLVQHNAPVYCFTVPSGAFMVRRKGKVFITGNCPFDGFILSQHYGVFPAYYCDTMAMSRGLRGMNGSHSLKALVSTLGIDKEMGNKIEGTLDDAKGVRDLPPDQLRLMGEYCIQDVRLTMRAFERMMAMRYPVKELHIIDMVCRAFCDPQLLVDTQLCLEEIDVEQARLSALLEKVGVPASRLASNQQFAQLLTERGIDPPMKPSPSNPDRLTWAFGAKDPEFIELGKNPDIADLIVARKKVKSRIAETRAHSLIAHSRPTLPILLNYGATQTHRLSGADRLNLQNLPSGRAEGQSTRLRNAIQAPPGYKLVIVDSAQIEARVAAALAGEEKLLEQFRTGGDPYSDLATKIFGYPVKKGMLERNVGKAAVLACQYGVGRVRIHTAVTTGQAGPPMDIGMDVADKTVRTYRAEMRQIVNFWNQLDTAISHMARPDAEPLQVGIFSFQHERVMMPNGLFMYYPGLYCTDSELGDWTYKKHQGRVKLYSMKLFEQLVQSTSRTIFLIQALEVARRYPRIPFTVHDEAIFLVKEDEADDCLAYALECFTQAPEFLPDVPLEGEGQISPYYTK